MPSINTCINTQRLPQATFLGLVVNTSVATMLNNLPLSQWEIVSFDPKTAQVCIRIYRNFNQSALQNEEAALRVQLAAETDPAQRRNTEAAIREVMAKLTNPPSTLISAAVQI